MNHDDYVEKQDHHAVIMARLWPCFALINVWSWLDHSMAAMFFQLGAEFCSLLIEVSFKNLLSALNKNFLHVTLLSTNFLWVSLIDPNFITQSFPAFLVNQRVVKLFGSLQTFFSHSLLITEEFLTPPPPPQKKTLRQILLQIEFQKDNEENSAASTQNWRNVEKKCHKIDSRWLRKFEKQMRRLGSGVEKKDAERLQAFRERVNWRKLVTRKKFLNLKS